MVRETSHNSFYVNCKNLSGNDWNGMHGNYTAKLINKGTTEKIESYKDCYFLFENLYYHTDYIIEVFIYFFSSLSHIIVLKFVFHSINLFNSDYSHEWKRQ